MIRLAVVAVLAMGTLIGSGIAKPLPAAPTVSAYQPAGYYLPDGRYVYTRVRVCWRQFIGYDVYGARVYRTVCQWQLR